MIDMLFPQRWPPSASQSAARSSWNDAQEVVHQFAFVTVEELSQTIKKLKLHRLCNLTAVSRRSLENLNNPFPNLVSQSDK